MVGLGSPNALIKVFIENTPPLPQYQQLTDITPMQAGEIASVAEQTGNHWRKIFNVYAKLAFELNQTNFASWQELRDKDLLQADSNYSLVFSKPKRNELSSRHVNIIMGKGYATELGFADCTYWLTPYLAINELENIIVCPYFDYRQLSNQKITQLVALIKPLRNLALRIPTKEIGS